MDPIKKLLRSAINETKKLKKGEVFLVRELFKGYEWNRIPKKDRILLGTLFLNYVKENSDNSVEAIEKTRANQQKYIKK
ncbi:single-stranded DNA-binding protein [Ligilactobacillus agilis]|uniref:single-stranded DNA-binding protein n=1 Tax=Ligilactobacillus agilis TaxID=1601 RepID=UPI0022E85B9C|nr:single-stranded DNA-binding protein [Ligilactobacillus agilis]